MRRHKKDYDFLGSFVYLVPSAGIEPARLAGQTSGTNLKKPV